MQGEIPDLFVGLGIGPAEGISYRKVECCTA